MLFNRTAKWAKGGMSCLFGDFNVYAGTLFAEIFAYDSNIHRMTPTDIITQI